MNQMKLQVQPRSTSTDRQLANEFNTADHDYSLNPQIQSEVTFLNKFFFFNRLALLYHYLKEITKETIYRYNDAFTPMLSTSRIFQKYITTPHQQQFDILHEILQMEKRSILAVIFLSLLAGAISLVPIYFQQLLTKQIVDVETQNNYWTVGVIIGAMVIRFSLLNYVLNIANNTALNIKIYLQNVFMRCIFYIDESEESSFISRVKFLDVDVIGEAFYYLPYLIISLSLVIGVIVFIFTYIGKFGTIVLAVFIFDLIIIAFIGYYAYSQLSKATNERAFREVAEKNAFMNLLKLSFQRVSKYVFQFLATEKQKEIKRFRKITLSYILGQAIGESFIIVSNIFLFLLVHLGADVLASDIYICNLFLISTFYPIKFSVYGFFTILKAAESFSIFRKQLRKMKVKNVYDIQDLPLTTHDSHVFAENVGDCFVYQYDQIDVLTPTAKSIKQESSKSVSDAFQMKFTAQDFKIEIEFKEGETIMIYSQVDSYPSCQKYLEFLFKIIPVEKTVAFIREKPSLICNDLKENILMFTPERFQEYHRILKITQLTVFGEMEEDFHKKHHLNEKYIRFNHWHETRIQLARALYQNVDFLLITRANLLEDMELVQNIIEQRKQRGKVTIINNNTHKYYFKLAHQLVIIGNKEVQIGNYKSLAYNQNSLFYRTFKAFHQKVDHAQRIPEIPKDINTELVKIERIQQKKFALEKYHYFQFFNLVHSKAEFIILLSLFAAPCFKYYAQILMGNVTTEDIFVKYLIFGLLYLIFVFLRGFTITMYTSKSSALLYEQICEKYSSLNAHQVLQIYQQPETSFSHHFRAIDKNLVMDFEYGSSILIEIVVAFVILSAGQPIFIAIDIPVVVIIVFINGFYAKLVKQLHLLRLKQTKGLHAFVANVIDRHRSISRYHKANQVNNIFHAQNKLEVIYNCNAEWVQTAMRTAAEIIVILLFVVFIIVMIVTQKNSSTYTKLTSMGLTMIINLCYLNTFYLKSFRQMQISLISLTICWNILKGQPHLSDHQKQKKEKRESVHLIKNVQRIIFHKVSLFYQKSILKEINLGIKKGERVVLSGNASSYKEMVFYLLDNTLFDSTTYHGEIYINNQRETSFEIEGLFYLHSNPLLPIRGNIWNACQRIKDSLTLDQCNASLQAFFQFIEIPPLFNAQTIFSALDLAQKQLVELYRVLMLENCKILILIDGLNHLDIVSRRKLTRILIQKSQIEIILEATNLPEIIQLYHRNLVFVNCTIASDHKINQNKSAKKIN